HSRKGTRRNFFRSSRDEEENGEGRCCLRAKAAGQHRQGSRPESLHPVEPRDALSDESILAAACLILLFRPYAQWISRGSFFWLRSLGNSFRMCRSGRAH